MAKVVAKVYGDALFDLAVETKQLDQVEEEVKALKETILENDELNQFMNHPKISKEEKITALENIYKGMLSDTVVGFLVTIVEKGRYQEIEAIITYVEERIREYKKIGKALVVSAFELNDEQKDQIENRLLQLTDYVDFQMDFQVDASLIGGLIIRIGDRVVDSSIKSKIELMKKDLLKLQLSN